MKHSFFWRIAIPYVLLVIVALGSLLLAIPNVQGGKSLPATLWVIFGITILLAVAIAFILARCLSKPLTQLTQAAQKTSQTGIVHPVPSEYDDETGLLVMAFNQMSARLIDQIDSSKKEQAMLSSVMNTMNDGIVIVNSEGIVELINPAAEKLFKVDAKNAAGHSLVEVVRQHQLVDLWQSCLSQCKQQVITLEALPERIFLQCIATPLDPNLPGSTLLILQDLTLVRRLETVRRDFVSNVSHELRTPLASLKAISETLQEGALEDKSAAQRFLQSMDGEIDTMIQMVEELLELSRIESGRVPLKTQPIRPSALLTPAGERMRLQVRRAKLKLSLSCPEDLPEVQADPDRIEQVLINLLHNAIKFTPPGGKIDMTAKSGENEVIFAVRDTGIGISPEDLPRIFERFYKADRARTSVGTGLGLSISRHLVEAHNGRIWAESEQGKGSTFFFSLPIVFSQS
jgi:two-component system phosphate regulon sensor histidine kinase PhoR